MNSSEAEIEAQEGVDVVEEAVEGDKVKLDKEMDKVEVREAAAPPLTVQTGHLCAPGKNQSKIPKCLYFAWILF